MQRTLILHVGLGKTGSTSIQKYMEQIAGRNTGTVFYPISPDVGLFSEHICKAVFLSNSRSILEEARQYLKQQKESSFIVSGEILTHSDINMKTKVYDFFSSIFDRIFFIAYVRDPFAWNSASASQLILDGASINELAQWPYLETQYGFLRFYLDTTKRYDQTFLIVRKFEDAISRSGGVAEDFKTTVENICGEYLPKTTVDNFHENRSKTIIEYFLLGHINRLKKAGAQIDQEKLTNFKNSVLKKYNSNSFTIVRFFQYYALPQVKISTDYDILMLNDRFKISYEPKALENLSSSHAAQLNGLLSSTGNQSELLDSMLNYLHADNGFYRGRKPLSQASPAKTDLTSKSYC